MLDKACNPGSWVRVKVRVCVPPPVLFPRKNLISREGGPLTATCLSQQRLTINVADVAGVGAHRPRSCALSLPRAHYVSAPTHPIATIQNVSFNDMSLCLFLAHEPIPISLPVAPLKFLAGIQKKSNEPRAGQTEKNVVFLSIVFSVCWCMRHVPSPFVIDRSWSHEVSPANCRPSVSPFILPFAGGREGATQRGQRGAYGNECTARD